MKKTGKRRAPLQCLPERTLAWWLTGDNFASARRVGTEPVQRVTGSKTYPGHGLSVTKRCHQRRPLFLACKGRCHARAVQMHPPVFRGGRLRNRAHGGNARWHCVSDEGRCRRWRSRWDVRVASPGPSTSSGHGPRTGSLRGRAGCRDCVSQFGTADRAAAHRHGPGTLPDMYDQVIAAVRLCRWPCTCWLRSPTGRCAMTINSSRRWRPDARR
jgi:hypothetical protein